MNVDFRLNKKNGTEEYGCRQHLRILRKLLKWRLDRSLKEKVTPWIWPWKKRLASGEQLNYFTWEKMCQQKEKVSCQEGRITKYKRRKWYWPMQGTGAFDKMRWVEDERYQGREGIRLTLILSVNTPGHKYQWQEENSELKDHMHTHTKGYQYS